MAKDPGFYCYVNDWERDLGEHPLEIDGAWWRICRRLHFSPTRGRLERTLDQWAAILRVDIQKISLILEYLKMEDIATVHTSPANADWRAAKGITVISRRMVRDERIRKLRAVSGKKGGNPLLKKPREQGNLELLDNQNPTTQDKQITEIETGKSLNKKIKDFFDLFWKEYPLRNGQKVGRKEALHEIKDLKPDEDLQKIILESLRKQKDSHQKCKSRGEFVAEFPDAHRWVKKRRWEDEIMDPGGNGARAKPEPVFVHCPKCHKETTKDDLRKLGSCPSCFKPADALKIAAQAREMAGE